MSTKVIISDVAEFRVSTVLLNKVETKAFKPFVVFILSHSVVI